MASVVINYGEYILSHYWPDRFSPGTRVDRQTKSPLFRLPPELRLQIYYQYCPHYNGEPPRGRRVIVTPNKNSLALLKAFVSQIRRLRVTGDTYRVQEGLLDFDPRYPCRYRKYPLSSALRKLPFLDLDELTVLGGNLKRRRNQVALYDLTAHSTGWKKLRYVCAVQQGCCDRDMNCQWPRSYDSVFLRGLQTALRFRDGDSTKSIDQSLIEIYHADRFGRTGAIMDPTTRSLSPDLAPGPKARVYWSTFPKPPFASIHGDNELETMVVLYRRSRTRIPTSPFYQVSSPALGKEFRPLWLALDPSFLEESHTLCWHHVPYINYVEFGRPFPTWMNQYHVRIPRDDLFITQWKDEHDLNVIRQGSEYNSFEIHGIANFPVFEDIYRDAEDVCVHVIREDEQEWETKWEEKWNEWGDRAAKALRESA
ncbi:hypothetical protein QBC47DRAFT_355404 [Echria macrotheca]|uniref:Uncharacterized protein n=1 Tax=Echria macrotheca TaxID=438768 RepID=A0AAJ0FAK3_9PEZI|nr:hypothetical protein QBC47DRAFT_355404 [Echria macrotheca]